MVCSLGRLVLKEGGELVPVLVLEGRLTKLEDRVSPGLPGIQQDFLIVQEWWVGQQRSS